MKNEMIQAAAIEWAKCSISGNEEQAMQNAICYANAAEERIAKREAAFNAAADKVIARANEGAAKDARRAARAQEIIAAVEDIRRVYAQMPQHDVKFLMYDFNDVMDKLQSRCADRLHKKVFELINRGIEGDRYAL